MNLPLRLAVEGAHAESWLLDPHAGGLVFWTAVTFAFVLLALYKMAWGPLLKALADREAAIEGAVRTAEQTRLEAERIRQDYEAKLESIRQEAQSIIDEGNADKKRIIAEAHAQAEKDGREIRARAERDIKLAKDKALAEVKQYATMLGLAIAEKVIGAEVDANRHRTIVDEVLTSYERSA